MDDNRHRYDLEKQTRAAALIAMGLSLITTLIIFAFAYIQIIGTVK